MIGISIRNILKSLGTWQLTLLTVVYLPNKPKKTKRLVVVIMFIDFKHYNN